MSIKCGAIPIHLSIAITAKKQMAVKILPKIYTESHWALCDFLFVLGTFLVANLTVK